MRYMAKDAFDKNNDVTTGRAAEEGFAVLQAHLEVDGGKGAGITGTPALPLLQKLDFVERFSDGFDVKDFLRNGGSVTENLSLLKDTALDNRIHTDRGDTTGFGTCPICGRPLLKPSKDGLCGAWKCRQAMNLMKPQAVADVWKEFQEARRGVNNDGLIGNIKGQVKAANQLLSVLETAQSVLSAVGSADLSQAAALIPGKGNIIQSAQNAVSSAAGAVSSAAGAVTSAAGAVTSAGAGINATALAHAGTVGGYNSYNDVVTTGLQDIGSGNISGLRDNEDLEQGLGGAGGFDGIFAVYFKTVANMLMCYVKIQINNVLIWKNDLILELLSRKKNWTDGATAGLEALFAGVEACIAALAALNAQLNAAFAVVYKVAVESMVPFLIEPDSVNFGFTPRSLVRIPGKFVNRLPSLNSGNTSKGTEMTDAILAAFEPAFPPIMTPEWFMEPPVFRARLVMSDMNTQAICRIVEPLMMILKEVEPLPRYENLQVYNLQWIAFLLGSWGPQGINHFGIPGYP